MTYELLIQHQGTIMLPPVVENVSIEWERQGQELSRGKGLGGLASYTSKWIVIPDALIAQTVNYLDRLRGAMGDSASRVQCYCVREAFEKAVALKKGAKNA